ncbi:MAG: carbonic anhydrase [Clostridia bacterium]|nr:carbonic anhydrase [Clostridia bacterium]
MKKFIALLLLAALMLCSCGRAARSPENLDSAEKVMAYLMEGNAEYVAGKSSADISAQKRKDTAENGQFPYAVVVTCSDSRVPAEHIFSAGVGELFVIRTAGNVMGEFELGSVEYGAEHLGANLVVVLGHTGCGAVDAAMNGGAHGNIEKITEEISSCLTEGCTAREAEIINVRNSIEKIESTEIMAELIEAGKVRVAGAVYNIETGRVEFLD